MFDNHVCVHASQSRFDIRRTDIWRISTTLEHFVHKRYLWSVLLTKLIPATYIAVADPGGGGGGGGLSRHASPPALFSPKYFKRSSKLAEIYQKKFGGKPQAPKTTGAPPPAFPQILDPPLHSDKRVGCRTSILIYNSITLQCACGNIKSYVYCLCG